MTTITIYFLHFKVHRIEALYVMKYVWKNMQCLDLYEFRRLALLPYRRLQSVNAGAPHYFLPYYFSAFITFLYVKVIFLIKLRVCMVVSNEYTFLHNILVGLCYVNYVFFLVNYRTVKLYFDIEIAHLSFSRYQN